MYIGSTKHAIPKIKSKNPDARFGPRLANDKIPITKYNAPKITDAKRM
jgi:hypothetical protein